MANQFINLPAPAGDGSGGPVDVSATSKEKTVVVTGTWTGVVVIEGSEDGNIWTPLETYQQNDQRQIIGVQQFLRVTRSGVESPAGSPDVNVGVPDGTNAYESLDVPTVDGTGVASDTTALGSFKTIQVGGVDPVNGVVHIEIAEPSPATEFVTLVSFNNGGVKNVPNAAVGQMRVRLAGFLFVPPALQVEVGAEDD